MENKDHSVVDTRFCSREQECKLKGDRYTNHGKLWESSDLDRLEKLFAAGHGIAHICESLQRSAGGVLPKLSQLRLVNYDPITGCTVLSILGVKIREDYMTQTSNLKSEKTEMSTLDKTTSQVPVQQITYLYGQDVKKAHTDYLISSLKRAQADKAMHTALPENKFSSKQIAEADAAIALAIAELNTRV